ncbi:hypothetical protein [Parvularcula dongshanensis]|uniref:Uncharacterized protein n=1 Tax=Parvularcula dongshanensis TaxID=1173995 RepID=A0A840HZE7_9PROT|nr:hypothetical protein [Parvularcula dongshanensis]MBB4657939.1 hypothetical protein [Parvularcula dongshanensis]
MAGAQETNLQPVLVPSQSSVLNQNSVFLPTPPTATGQDMVRSAGGTSCQTAVASGGPFLDVGVIGSQDLHARDTGAVYGRLVVPIGRRAKRVDCTRLYDLEIQRLRMELEVLRAGVMVPQVQQADLPTEPAPIRPEQAKTVVSLTDRSRRPAPSRAAAKSAPVPSPSLKPAPPAPQSASGLAQTPASPPRCDRRFALRR